MPSDPKKIKQKAELQRVRLLSHLFDPDPECPEKISETAKNAPLPEGLGHRTAAAREFEKFLDSEFAEVRRLSASALGKMAPERPASCSFLPALARVARDDAHPQVRQYAAKAIKRYAADAFLQLDILKDVARDETAPQYVRTAAADAVAEIQTEHRRKHARSHHWCTRCRKVISQEEYFAGMARWGKPYCRHCLDEREIENVNFESTVEGAKTRRSQGGTVVQSRGEKQIADFLENEGIRYVYDERYRIAGDAMIRPDFYLPEFDVYIEYFGMDTPEYRDNMLKKRFLYQRAAKKLVSVSYKDNDNLIEVLRQKLSRYFRI